MKKILTLFSGFFLFSQIQVAFAATQCEPATGFCNSQGVAITGNNNRLGTTVFSWERSAALTFGQFVGAYNPDETLPNVIDPGTPDDAILASIAPPGFPLYGDNAPNIPYQNLRFQDVPHIISPTGAIGTLPSTEDVSPLVASSGSGKKDYTLGQWLAANGEMTLACVGDTTQFNAEFHDLVPNGGLYSMWAFWVTADGGFVANPFGGSGHNAFATDKHGSAQLNLELPYCALDEQDGAILVAVQLDFHSDDGITGALPNLPLVPGRGPGIIGHSHLILPVRGTPCEEVGNCVSRQ